MSPLLGVSNTWLLVLCAPGSSQTVDLERRVGGIGGGTDRRAVVPISCAAPFASPRT